MNRLVKIIAYSIAIGFVLIVVVAIIAIYLMGYNVADRRIGEIDNRDKIIERIESYISANGRLPESLSCVGFEQTYGGYALKGISGDPEDDFSNEFGEWKYYDVKGNCYRKFWNYKENGKLIYETDR